MSDPVPGQPQPQPQGGPSAGTVALLTTVAQSGDNWVKLATLALIALSGIGNWFATKSDGHATREDVSRVIHEVHEIYGNQAGYVQQLKTIEEVSQLSRQNAAQLSILAEQQRYILQFLYNGKQPETK
jgi:hypothetical protein